MVGEVWAKGTALMVTKGPKVGSRASMSVVAEVRDYLARRYPKPSVDPVCL